ncbi:MAG TPA: LapA family protein [Nitrospirae bacterium]|nr:LapA family protein [Nitrospirota bacterium]
MQVFLFLAMILVLGVLFFAVQNSEVITITFFNWIFEGSLALILALAFSSGLLAGILLFIPTWWGKMKTGRAQKKRINELEQQLLHAPEPEEDIYETEEAEE